MKLLQLLFGLVAANQISTQDCVSTCAQHQNFGAEQAKDHKAAACNCRAAEGTNSEAFLAQGDAQEAPKPEAAEATNPDVS